MGNNTLIGRKSFYGPRFDKKGDVIPRSIAGKPEVFQRVRNYRTFSMGMKSQGGETDIPRNTSPVPRLPVPQRLTSGGSVYTPRAATQKADQSRFKASSVAETKPVNSTIGDIQPTGRETAKDFSTARTAHKRSLNRTIPLTQENFNRLVQEIKQRTLSQHMQMSPLGSGGGSRRAPEASLFPSQRGGSLTGERIKAGRDQRAMLNYERINRFWSYQNAKLSEKLKRESEDTILVKSEDYRQKLESLETMEKATPCEMTYGTNLWYASLRNSGMDGDGSRAIPMGGNPTSGLFIRIKEKANKSTDLIRRPKKQNKSLFNFYKNPYLQKKMDSESSRISEIKPGKEDAIQLEVIGSSKLLNELEYAANIDGEKQLYLDHVVNDEGEGEPDFEEEIIAFHQDRIAKY